ncbi:MAG: type IIA DNA topoisomerase subunit B [Bacilli bacterium]|nr:type IIA DNA topoisomerase subunit B [Bacilli bacterium]
MSKYDANEIELLEGLEGVRKRPAMYIGSTNHYGLHHLVWEIVDNAVDEALNGFGNKISVTIHKDGSVTVVDEGRGIPCDINEKTGIPAVQLVFSTLHSGGKFSDTAYKSSAGLHGVGSSVTNALSVYCDVTVYRNNKIYHIRFENGGKIAVPLEILGNTTKHGTTVTFKPDGSIFSTTEFNYDRISSHLKKSAVLLKRVRFIVHDERSGNHDEFFYENGLKEYIEETNQNKQKMAEVFAFSEESQNIYCDIALQYCYNDYNETIESYVNNVHTADGGTHETGFKMGITKAVNEYAENNNLLRTKDKLEGTDIREGLTAMISLRLPESILEFEGQTKGKLGSQIAQTVVSNLVYTKFTYYLNENKEFAVRLVKKCLDSMNARNAARKAKEEARTKKKPKEQIILSDKLTPAQSKEYEKNELFIVEGDSAGGTAKKGRDPRYQAILPLRGKPLNTDGLTMERILQNQEFATIINTIGAGVGQNFDVEDSHYGKIIIMTDADTDGAHIQTLLLTFFYNYMRSLITTGHVYVAVPPLYRIYKQDAKGKVNEVYAWDDKGLEEGKAKIGAGYKVSRYKGLGEMSDKQLKETTMDPKNRMLIQIQIDDPLIVENKVATLMGKDSDKRKKWLEQNVDFNEIDKFMEEVRH